MMFAYKLLLLLMLLLTASALAENRVADRAFEFAVIGDLPYGVGIGERDEDFELLINELNADTELAWVLHIGDIKTGGSSCSDEMLKDRWRRFQRIKAPFIFTPGDNEWTDCHRPSTGNFDPLERLAFLRSLFYGSKREQADRKKLEIKTQAEHNKRFTDYVENYTWVYQDVRFATLHLVGSENGSKPFSTFSKHSRGKQHDREVDEREAAALSWLEHTFDTAKQQQERAVVLAIHANPGLFSHLDKNDHPAFEAFNRGLNKHIKSLDVPVLLVHGDSHYMRIDQPRLAGKRNSGDFTRLESFGETNKSWVKVKVDADTKAVFQFEIHRN